MVIGALGLLTWGTGRAAADIGACPVFPSDHILNTRVDTLPVHPWSAQYISSIGANTTLHPDFGSGLYEGNVIGIPFIAVSGTQPLVPIVFTDYGDQSDPGPYRIPPNAPIEGASDPGGDRHVLVPDAGNCVLYELYRSFGPFPPDNHWEAGSGATYDLRGYVLREDTYTSADAAGLPIFPLLVRYDEANAGEIRHAIRFTANVTQTTHVWPARHDAGSTSNPNAPAMGQRFRLKGSKDISGFPPKVRVIFQAFKTYGLILTDNGSDWYIGGAPDPSWDNDELVTAFRQFKGSDFEAVDVSSLLIDPNSAQARQPAPPVFTGGVYVAAGDINGDGRADIITAPGPGGGPHIRVFSGANPATVLASFFAYVPTFTGGVRVAAGDINGDGRVDIITGAGPGGGPHVQVFDGATGAVIRSFFAYSPEFTGGVRVAAADIDGDGKADIITAPGPGGGPHIRAFSGANLTELASFFAYTPTFTGGAYVAAGNVTGSATPEIVVGADAGGGPHVRVFTGSGGDVGGFFAYAAAFTGGVRVAIGNVDGTGPGEIITAPGAGGGPHIRAFTGAGGDFGVNLFAY